MATNVLLPQWGMNMEDGVLTKWLVKEGDAVAAGQALVDVETAKINSALESPVDGVVAHIMTPEGATVKVGEIVVVIGAPGESVPRPESAKPQASGTAAVRQSQPSRQPQAAQRVGRAQVTPVARRLARDAGIDADAISGTGPNGRVTEQDVRDAIEAAKAPAETHVRRQVVPAARKLAADNGIDIESVSGTGPNGRVLVDDVVRAIARQKTMPVRETIALSGLRRVIAERMMQSAQGMAQVTLTTEADVTEMVALREALVSRWRSERIRPLDLDIIIKAVAESLAEHPRLNAHLVGDEIRLMERINVGAAMAVPDGLVVPVVADADSKSALEIAKRVRELAEGSRKGTLGYDDMTNATFTITSLSSYDIDAFTPLIDPPQVAILGVGRVVDKPAVHRGAIAVRSMMYLSLTFDHRALDGVPAGEFLKAVKSRLEDPWWIDPAARAQEA
jgi:pyruvate dehydrogenase E2 component (dihydrolipoamide acetyltransferase)